MRAMEDIYSPDLDYFEGAAALVDRIEEVQEQLAEDGIDGWLLYDFCGSNPTATKALGLDGLMLTRRIMYFIPAQGTPTLLYHAIDSPNLPPLSGRPLEYTGWRDLNRNMAEVLSGSKRVAMEYFKDGAIPYLSRVDGGTLGWIRDMGVEVVPSADLVQFFLCRFSPEQAEAHREVAQDLDCIKDKTFAMVGRKLKAGLILTEYDVQQYVMEHMSRRSIITDHPPVVSCGERTANPHYMPSFDGSEELEKGQLVMVALWGRHDRPVCAYADIAWMAHIGPGPDKREVEAFELVVEARSKGLELLRRRYKSGSKNGLEGWEVDRAVRDVFEAKGLGDCFDHRTGHNLGIYEGHGDGTHIDDLETHDTRPLIQGLAFTMEPGLYFDDFGVRSSIDIFLGPQGIEVTSPAQDEIVIIDL